MNKNEFLHVLQKELNPLGPAAISEILADFEEHFANGLARGKSEDEITAELGNPAEIAQQYRESAADGPSSRPVVQFYQYQDPVNPSPQEASTRETAPAPAVEPAARPGGKINETALISVLVFNLFIGIPVWISLFAILISFWAAVGGIGVAAIALFVVAILKVGVTSLILALFGVALTALLVLAVILMVYLTKWLAKGLGYYVRWNKRLVTGGASA